MCDRQPGAVANGDKGVKRCEGRRGDTRATGHVGGSACVEVPVGGAWRLSGDAGAGEGGVQGAVVPCRRAVVCWR
jgi:hypothetical protein